MKKAFVVMVVLVLMLTVSLTAMAAETTIEVKKFTAAPALDGVISEGEYPDDSWFVLDKELATSLGGVWEGAMVDGMQARYNFGWTDNGIYLVLEAADTTPIPATSWDSHGNDGGSKADAFQVTPESEFITIGAYENGNLSIRQHAAPATDDISAAVTGKGARTDGKLTIEVYIPWDKFYSKAVAQGSKIPVLFTYMDRNATGEVNYKAAGLDTWSGNDTDTELLLSDKTFEPAGGEAEPTTTVADTTTTAAETAAPTTAAPETTAKPSSPNTGDSMNKTIFISSIVLLAAALVIVSIKKSRSV